MNVIKYFLTKHPNYKQAKKRSKTKLMLHSVGCAQPSAMAFAKKWNSSLMKKGVHAMIDAITGDAVQLLPWDYKAWHCGGSGNSTHIGVEMCEPSAIKYTHGASFVITDKKKALAQAKTSYDSAVELFAMLCKQYKLNPLEDICSHNEGHKKGIASGHVDPEHLWKGLGIGYTMDGFRKDVYLALHPEAVNPAPKPKDKSYKIKVTSKTLNVRALPKATSKKVGVLAKGGVYTIVEEQNGWGKLKSGLGWINLKYTTLA